MTNPTRQVVLIVAALVASWLGMQAVHEAGHVLGAYLTGGRVTRVVLHPLTISRTDVAENHAPLRVAWAGPLFGCVTPLLAWACAATLRVRLAFLLRFFAGFCLLANGLYIGLGSFEGIGDAGEMLRHGSPIWSLWLFGILTAPVGLAVWHRQGAHFGFGELRSAVSLAATVAAVTACVVLVVLGVLVGE